MPLSPDSRYFYLPQRSTVGAEGEEQFFLARRIIPQADSYGIAQTVRADKDSRIDWLAAQAIGNPLLYWQICDANGLTEPATALQPDGKTIGIPIPRGPGDA